MSSTVTKSTRLRRRRTVAAGAALVVALFGVQAATAVHDEGFSLLGTIDGNPIDWIDLFDVAGSGAVTPKASLPAPVFNAAFEADYVLPDQSGYATGTKDTLPISTGWQCKTPNNLGDKFDLLNAYAAALVPTSGADAGDLIVYFGSEVSSPNGNRNMGLWLLQDDGVDCSGVGNTDFTGEHQDGDVFIVSAFTGGGAVANIDVYEWVDLSDDNVENGALQLKAGFANATCPPSAAADDACAIANTDGDKVDNEAQYAIDTPWPAPDKDGGDLNEAEFLEGGVNLSDLGLEGCFATFLANSRSSQETTSTLHDFAAGQFETCFPTELTTLLKQDNPPAGADAGDTSLPANGDHSVTLPVNVYDTSTLTGGVPDPTGTITYSLWTNNTCTTASTNPTFSNGTNVADPVTVGQPSPTLTFTVAGTYWWKAVYTPSAGSRNDPSASVCSTEPLIVQGVPTLETTILLSDKVRVGDVAGAGDVDGTVTFTLHSGTACGGAALATFADVALDSNDEAMTSTPVAVAAGSYSWKVTFTPAAGLDLYLAASTTCSPAADEQATITYQAPSPIG